ncbi:MAG: nucleotidyl transferase AbiEii/AbiGii toxin family protein [Candidatus Methanomethylophilaceae archaeon]|nr:nucleotidyl transferase AbiEii/AbiGii toxin family protein [Candidatus Methanomethylophilaceae archaeon]
MDIENFINAPRKTLMNRIRLASEELDLNEAMVEKDLWVTLLLRYLFRDSPWKDHLLFKGGTCLSKCHDVIDRFSEDVDLLLDWRVLGYGVEGPAIEPSRKKQESSNESLIGRTEQFIDTKFVPTLKEDLSRRLNVHFDIVTRGRDVIVRYGKQDPTGITDDGVLIEMGPRGSWGTPVRKELSSYVSKAIPELDDRTEVRCIPLEQAYYEKIQILHSAASRGRVPARYSRHYYDVYRIHRKLGRIQFDDLALNNNVEYNRRFYPGAGFGYDTMEIGSYRLMPTDDMIGPLREDYAHMRDMIFGDIPSLEDILTEISQVEDELNSGAV